MPAAPSEPLPTAPPRQGLLADAIDWVVWFGVATALGQTAVVTALRTLTTRLVFVTQDIVWRGPIANLALYAVAGLLLMVAFRTRSRATTLGVTTGVFVFAGVVGPVLQVPKLHPYAGLLLAAGVAMQVARFVMADVGRARRVVSATKPWLVGLCAVTALGFLGLREMRVRRTEAALPVLPGTTPNILLIVLDTVRAQSLGVYGNARATSPNIDALAATGVRFQHAIAPAPWTLPSHASMFTARAPHELSADWLRPLDSTNETLAAHLQASGYATVGEVANLLYTTSSSGLDRGFLRYSDFTFSWGTLLHESWVWRPLKDEVRRTFGLKSDRDDMVRKSAREVTDGFLAWTTSRPERPFFAFLNYFDAHAPYLPPDAYLTKFGARGPAPDLTERKTVTPEEASQALAAYEGAIAYTDAEIGRLLSTLKANGVLDHTIVILTADHGEQFGEHGLFDHANSLYRPLLHVPLIVAAPGRVPAGRVVDTPVSLMRLAPTVLDLAGLQSAAPSPFEGRTLSAHWTGGDAPGEPVYSEVSQGINTLPWLPVTKGSMQSVVLDGWHYIRGGDGSEEMYDFAGDPAEAVNRVSDPALAPHLEAARAAARARFPQR